MKAPVCCIILCSLLVASCAPMCDTYKWTYSNEQKRYIDNAFRQPVTFLVTTTEANDAWGRAQAFVGRYGVMKLETVTDFVLHTYNSTGTWAFSYRIVRSPLPNGMTEFNVSCDQLGCSKDEQ